MSISKRSSEGEIRVRNALRVACVALLLLLMGSWFAIRQASSTVKSGTAEWPSAAEQAADLGLILQSSKDGSGVYVLAVMDQGAASCAGIQAGDTILSVDGIPLASAADFDASLQSDGGAAMLLTLRRGERSLELTLIP